ncbi:hypothetical protein HLB23_35640 [Nocardia uniformis]|uniref:Uncharacterized protein n=1 Tax=Nocardia uniformis TaxID=53432 RepID=A0A849CBA6_9NOCA|nr:hypothetical protein [Nocardia uniformis]NNH75126.1 hypothetical protein [Nocardia uniformis]
MSDPNNAWGSGLKQSATDGGFGVTFDPSVATTLSAECASMLSAVEEAAGVMTTARELKPLNLKISGPELATMINTAAADLDDRLVSGHRKILTDMGETFVIAGGLYNRAEEDSQSAFQKLTVNANRAPVQFEGAELPGWRPSSRYGHEFYSHSADRDYTNTLATTSEAVSLDTLAEHSGVTVKPTTLTLDSDLGENYTWDEFAAQYDHVDGQQIPGQLQHFADSWKQAADILRAQSAAFKSTYEPLLPESPDTAATEGIWASPAASRAKAALDDYLTGMSRLISGMDVMSRNLAFTQGWLSRLQTFLPLHTYEVYLGSRSARTLDAELRQIQSTWDTWYVEGAKLTAGSIPDLPPARSIVTTPSIGGLPTSLTELLIGDQSPGQTNIDPVAMANQLGRGIPVEVVNPDGSHTIITPNPDGTTTTTTSTKAPDGSVTTVSKTDGGPAVTSVSTPRNDGSGIIDTVTTNADGSVTTTVTTPIGGGRLKTTTTNPDGTPGPESIVSPLAHGGMLTETADSDSRTVSATVTRSDGFSYTETGRIDENGKPQLLSTIDSSGKQAIIQSDEAVFTTFGDGSSSTTTRLPDGSTFTQFSDGTIWTTDAPQPDQPAVSAVDAAMAFLGFEVHPNTTLGGMAASGIAAGMEVGGGTMAEKAAMMARTSQLLGQGALQDLADGAGLPGKQTSVALQIGDDASKLAGQGKLLGTVGKVGGPLATIGFATYNSWDDYNEGRKSGWAAIGNGVGTSVGGIGGGMLIGAAGGALFGPPGMIVGAILGGLGGGAAGGLAGETAMKAVTE